MKKAQSKVIAILLVVVVIALFVIAFRLYFPHAKVVLNENGELQSSEQTPSTTNEKEVIEETKDIDTEIVDTSSTDKEKSVSYRFKCVTNCDRGLSIFDQFSFDNKITIELKNENPRQCNMFCIFHNGVQQEYKLTYDENDKFGFIINYSKMAGKDFEILNLDSSQLVCAESGDFSRPGVCSQAIKQIFEIEEVVY